MDGSEDRIAPVVGDELVWLGDSSDVDVASGS